MTPALSASIHHVLPSGLLVDFDQVTLPVFIQRNAKKVGQITHVTYCVHHTILVRHIGSYWIKG